MNCLKKYVLYLTVIFSPFFAYTISSQYKVLDLGTLETNCSNAVWINDKNQVLGKYVLNETESFFIWSEKQGLRVLEIPEKSIVYKLNNRGQVLCKYYTETKDGISTIGKYEVGIWDPCFGFKAIRNDGSNLQLVVKDLNDYGGVIGYFERDGKQIPFLWTDSEFKELEGYFGELGIPTSSSMPMGIDNHFNVVGYSTKALVHKGKIVANKNIAVIWRASNNWAIEEIFPDYLDTSVAQCINNSGKVICHKEFCGSGVYDINTKEFHLISALDNPRSFKKNYVISANFILREVYSKNGESLATINMFSDPKLMDSIWRSNFYVSNINAKGYAVGSAITVYNEPHAIILVPCAK